MKKVENEIDINKYHAYFSNDKIQELKNLYTIKDTAKRVDVYEFDTQLEMFEWGIRKLRGE